MREKRKSRYKLNLILSAIGMIVSIICLILEIVVLHESVIFWALLLFCNAFIFVGSLINYRKL